METSKPFLKEVFQDLHVESVGYTQETVEWS
jgi:hypothetical protein